MNPYIMKAEQAIRTRNDSRWASVVARDAVADGQFYYSVKTTGVYCFPSCKARLARPENVQFHLTRADAEKAGFRPCKRCKPERLLSAAQRRAANRISFALDRCSLGAILLAAGTGEGICAILIDDDPAALIRDLRDRFPDATLNRDQNGLKDQMAKVRNFVDQPQRGLNLSLDIRGTAFQQRVWEALRQIPIGSTASYSDIARKLGDPKSVRAVAKACAANPLAVAIPCHRVVRSDGALSGYRWGVERKRALLNREAQEIQEVCA